MQPTKDKKIVEQISREIVESVSRVIYYKLLHAKYLPEIEAIQKKKKRGYSLEEIKGIIKKKLST